MTRPLRVEYPSALYHVMNRGNQKQDIFKKSIDYELFLEKLDYFRELFDINIFCYCLMKNHFHLLLQTNQANLGRFMQSFSTSFTLTLNKRNQKAGHLFQGRYKAHLIESHKYLSEVSKYIHLNPVRINKYQNTKIEEKRTILVNYKWSSFTFHIGLQKKPNFLDIKPALTSWGTSQTEKMKNYRNYVEEGLFHDKDNPFKHAIRQHIIGSETFAEKITRERLLTKEIKDSREERELIHIRKSISPQFVIDRVAEYFKIDKIDKILKRKSCHQTARKLAMYLCCQYCTNTTSLTCIGKYFGVSISGLTRARDRVNESIQKNNEKKIIIECIKTSIAKVLYYTCRDILMN